MLRLMSRILELFVLFTILFPSKEKLLIISSESSKNRKHLNVSTG
jgi:hypothetical protein